MKCPWCHGDELIHEAATPEEVGFWYCDECSAELDEDGSLVLEGVAR